MGKPTSSIPNPWTIELGGAGSPLTVDTDSNSNIAITQPIVTNSTSKSDSTADVKIEPLKVDTTSDIKIEPLKVDSDSRSQIDLKPLAIDSCQTIKLAPLPPIHMEQPYSQHFGITFMGTELWGVNISGKSEMLLHSSPRSQYRRGHPGEQEDRECGAAEHKNRDNRIRVRVGGKSV